MADALGVPQDGTADGSRAVAAVRTILQELGFPVLRDIGVTADELDLLTSLACADYFITQAPAPWDRGEVLAAFQSAYALESR
mgnify:CR=1 FL=1